jgi:hypothetical protein
VKTPLGIGIVSPIVTFALTVIYDLIKSKPILSTIGSVIIAVWKFIVLFLNFQLKVWWVLLGVVLIIAVLYVIAKTIEARSSDTEKPEFLNYTADNINEWKLEWSWKQNSNGEYALENLHPICPNCATPLVQVNPVSLKCPRSRCNYSKYTQMHDMEHIKVIFYDNARRMMNNTK